MRLLRAVLQIILCVMLALNGGTLAAASAHHSLISGERAEKPHEPSHGAAPAQDCHDSDSVAVESVDVTTEAALSEESGLPECCKTSSCAGVCMMPASACVSTLAAHPVVVDHSRVTEAPAVSFASIPPLPSIRPPITE